MRKIELTEKSVNNSRIFGLIISESETVLSFPEISPDKERIEYLISRLKNEDISMLHIQDIVRDFITENTYDILIANSLL